MKRTQKWLRTLAPVVTLALVVGTASPGYAEALDSWEPNAGTIVLDLLIVRPASLVRTMLGGFVLLGAYPLSLFSGASDNVVEVAVLEPFEYLTNRPLGEF